ALAFAAIWYVPPIRGNVTGGSDLLEKIFDEQPIEPLRVFAATYVDRHLVAAVDHCVVSATVATHSTCRAPVTVVVVDRGTLAPFAYDGRAIRINVERSHRQSVHNQE